MIIWIYCVIFSIKSMNSTPGCLIVFMQGAELTCCGIPPSGIDGGAVTAEITKGIMKQAVRIHERSNLKYE